MISGEQGQAEDAQAEDDAASESDVDIAPVGFSQLLKHYSASTGKGSTAKSSDQAAKQKAKVVKAKAIPARPAVGSVPTSSTTKSGAPPPANPASTPPVPDPLKVDIGHVKRPRRGKNKQQTNETEMDLSLGVALGNLDSDGLSEADRTTLDHYEAKVKAFKEIKPPLADGPFKGYLTDLSQQITAVSNEVKTKKRSAVRRAGKDEDPLYVELNKIHDKLSNLQQLVKCALFSLL